LLVLETVPDAVAGDDHELAAGVNADLLDVGERDDHLLVAGQERLLVGEVADGAREREVALDPVFLDAAARCLNAVFLLGVGRLVVLGQRFCDAFLRDYSPRVAGVRTVDVVVLDVDYNRGGASDRPGAEFRSFLQVLVFAHFI